MMQTFQYPNLLTGTDRTDWWTPVVGVANSARALFYVDFGRPLVVGDVVTVTADLDFDKLDITKDGAYLTLQGATSVDGVTRVWKYSNPLNTTNFRNVYRRAGTVLDGTDRYELSNVVGEGNGIGVRGAEFGVRVDYSGGGRLRVRRLMAELNAEGAPHAWAPSEGETLAGGGALMSANALGGITPELMNGTAQSGIWYETASGDCLKYTLDIPAHGDNQTFNLASTVYGESAGWIGLALEYIDAYGHTNRAVERMYFTTEQARRKVAIVVPSGMAVKALYVSRDESQPASRVANIALWQGELIADYGLALDIGTSGDILALDIGTSGDIVLGVRAVYR